MIGDGDLDGKVWAAVEAGGLVMDGRNAAKLVSGVYKSGRKVCKDVLTAMVKKYQTILHNYNAESYSLDAVKCLVEAGADVNMRDYRGCTPLHCAKAADTAIVQYLVECKADPSIKDNDGLTPLGSASRWHSNHDVADYLRSIGAPK
jgi:serine/threonine-protein phosphatase 6 regulatory ankyrin repeat subunit A